MCQIIQIKKGTAIDKEMEERLERFKTSNPHGMGVATILNDGSVKVEKRIDGVGGLIAYLECHKEFDNIVHFRYKTGASANSKQNAHPFSFDGKLREELSFTTSKPLLFHNGVLSTYEHAGEVDTYNFIKYAIKDNSNYISMLELYGKNNRFALIEDGEVTLFGDWKEKDGVKYANDKGIEKATPYNYAPSYVSYGGASSGYRNWNDYSCVDDYCCSGVGDDAVKDTPNKNELKLVDVKALVGGKA